MSPLSSDLATRLRTRAEQHDVLRFLPQLEALARTSLVASIGERGSGSKESGHSRLGGFPELEPSEGWPSSDGKLMRFVGQINLAELSPSELPGRGLLSFFVGRDEPASDVEHRLVVSSPGNIRRLAIPEDGEFHHEPALVHDASLSFVASLSLPDPWALEASEAERERLSTLCDELGADGTRLLGHATTWSSDSAMHAYLCRSGHKDILYTSHLTTKEHEALIARAWEDGDADRGEALEAQRTSHAWFRGALDHHRAEADHWNVLFQVISYRKLAMHWWGSGMLQFMIDDRDLAKGDFSRTYAAIQGS